MATSASNRRGHNKSNYEKRAVKKDSHQMRQETSEADWNLDHRIKLVNSQSVSKKEASSTVDIEASFIDKSKNDCDVRAIMSVSSNNNTNNKFNQDEYLRCLENNSIREFRGGIHSNSYSITHENANKLHWRHRRKQSILRETNNFNEFYHRYSNQNLINIKSQVAQLMASSNDDHTINLNGCFDKSVIHSGLYKSTCHSSEMLPFKLTPIIITYIILSSLTLSLAAQSITNYWTIAHLKPTAGPLAITRHFHQPNQNQNQNQNLNEPNQNELNRAHQLNQNHQRQPEASVEPISAEQAGRRLMIGQAYNNFSSIVPYSVVHDSDYGASSQEDQIIDEDDPSEAKVSELQAASWLQQQQAIHQAAHTVNRPNLQKQTSEAQRSDMDLTKSRALLPLDSSRLMLPHMQQIKSRFNQGCVGGTKCQFFAFCWMSGGSLGASCGLLMTCCVTPSRQEIQPGFYGPVVNDPYCGRSTSKINRIVGGTDASFGQFPWQAFVQVGGSRCGGALISSRHVVTAGHCVARSQHSPSSIKVTLGDYILNSDIESIPHEVFSVVEVLLHPNFRFTPQADRYDVAVLELDRTASYKDNIKPICLPQKDATFVGRVAYVAGWGALQAGSKLRPKVLQHVAVPVIENHVCEGWHRRKGIDIRIYDEMMCAGYELGQRDACQGDSGGPLMLNQFGVWYLVGIVSAGYSCAKQYQPGIYHRVSSSSDWISSNVYQQGTSNN